MKQGPMTQRVEGQELKGSEPAGPAVKPQRCSCYLGTGSLDALPPPRPPQCWKVFVRSSENGWLCVGI